LKINDYCLYFDLVKLQVLQENLADAINLASRFTSARAQLPVLSNILFSANNNRLLISATNLEVSINMSIGAKLEEEGDITVPSRVITDIISNLNPGPVSLVSDKEKLKVATSEFKTEISGMNASDFPQVPQKLDKKSVSIPKDTFFPSLSKILYAVSVDETRPILTGVLFIFKRGMITIVSTDGFRLSYKEIKAKGVNFSQKVIIPKGVLNELVRIPLEEDNLSLSFREKDNQVVFRLGNIVLSSRIIEGEFPDFEKVIPKDSKIKVNLDKESLIQAVKLASVFARDSANIIKMSVRSGSVEITAESQYTGSQKTKIEAKTIGGEVEIAFNFRFLLDFLQSVKGDDINIKLGSPSSPGVFIDPKDDKFLHLIMPVKIQS